MIDTVPWFTLWFILTNGTGYMPPMEVRPSDKTIVCSLPGEVIGVQLNKLENPTKVLWPDPVDSGLHCEVDITVKVASLPPGEYHVATTYMGISSKDKPQLPHDPHVSIFWLKSTNNTSGIPRLLNVRIH